MIGQCVNSGLIGLEIDGRNAGNALRTQAIFGKSFGCEFDQLIRFTMTFASDAKRQNRRVIDNLVIVPFVAIHFHRLGGGANDDLAGVAAFDIAVGQPGRRSCLDLEPGGFTGQKGGGGRFGGLRIGKMPTHGWFIKGQSQHCIARRGDRRLPSQPFGQIACQPIAAMMPAQKRNKGAASFVDGDNGRILPFAGQKRRQCADQDARCANTDNHMIG